MARHRGDNVNFTDDDSGIIMARNQDNDVDVTDDDSGIIMARNRNNDVDVALDVLTSITRASRECPCFYVLTPLTRLDN